MTWARIKYRSLMFSVRWWFRRKIENALIKSTRRLPRIVRYWTIVTAACDAEPNGNPSEVTALQMMQHLS